MDNPSRLAEIKARRLPCRPCDQGLEGDCTCLDWLERAPGDIDWLVAEVERLREQEVLAIELGELLPKVMLERDRLRDLLVRHNHNQTEG